MEATPAINKEAEELTVSGALGDWREQPNSDLARSLFFSSCHVLADEERRQWLRKAATEVGIDLQTLLNQYADAYAERDHELERLLQGDAEKAEWPEGLEIVNLNDLLDEPLPETKWTVPNLIPEGLVLLPGPQKTGKSFFSLDLCIACANGFRFLDHYNTEPGAVLYVPMEDGRNRVHRRAQRMLDLGNIDSYSAGMKRVDIATKIPFLDRGGLDSLRHWLDRHSDARLIVLDTLGRIRPPSGRNTANAYENDTQALAPLQRLAVERGVTVLAVHHLRKLQAEDPFDQVSGSTAITAVADATLILKRTTRGQADGTLEFVGRDIEGDGKIALTFDAERLRWRYLGDAQEVQRSKERQEILDAMRANDGPMSPKQIADHIGKSRSTVAHLISKLQAEGAILGAAYGKYIIHPVGM